MKNKSRKIISALVLCVALMALSVTAYAATDADGTVVWIDIDEFLTPDKAIGTLPEEESESIGDDEVIIGGTDVPMGIMTAE